MPSIPTTGTFSVPQLPEVSLDVGLALWCPPPFDGVLGDDESVLSKLMKKGCDIPEIMAAAESKDEPAE